MLFEHEVFVKSIDNNIILVDGEMEESVTNLTKNHPEYCMEDTISSEKDD